MSTDSGVRFADSKPNHTSRTRDAIWRDAYVQIATTSRPRVCSTDLRRSHIIGDTGHARTGDDTAANIHDRWKMFGPATART